MPAAGLPYSFLEVPMDWVDEMGSNMQPDPGSQACLDDIEERGIFAEKANNSPIQNHVSEFKSSSCYEVKNLKLHELY